MLDSTVKKQGKRLDSIEQYFKFDNLLLHKFHLPSNYLPSLQFSHYIANQINYFLPQLLVPVTWEHISDAHPLKTKNSKSNVIIVRFCNRNIRHEIYSKRHLLRRGMYITEHLTENNLKVLNRAKELFGFNSVSTEKCNIIITVGRKTHRVQSIEDVNELFEEVTIHHSVPSYANVTSNVNNDSQRQNNHSTHEQSNKSNFSRSTTRSTQRQNYRSYPKPNTNNSHFNNYNNNIQLHYPTHNGYSVRNRHYPNT